MQIFNLSPDAPQINNVNVTEDVRTALAPITGSRPITLRSIYNLDMPSLLPFNIDLRKEVPLAPPKGVCRL
jgi:hypothetical protein